MPDLADPRFAVYEKSKFALQIFSVLGEGAIKSAVALLYIRIFSVRKYRIAVQVVLILTVGWTISLFFATLFQCYPITAFVESIYENTCVDTEALWYAVSISDIIFDFILLIIPIPVILGLQLPWKEKVGVIFMFLLGGLASASSIIRLVIFHRVFGELAIHFNDETCKVSPRLLSLLFDAYRLTDYTSPVFFWSAIEVWLGVIAVCLPTLRPVFKRVHVLATTGSRGADSYDSMDGASKLRDGGQAKHTGIRSKDYSKLTYGGGSQIDSGDLEMLDSKYPSNFSVKVETSTVTDDAVAFPEGAIVIQHNLSQHSYNQERV